jgi:hypothetical protein
LRIVIKLLYALTVKAVFVELPVFERHRANYLDEETNKRQEEERC